jgi:hypothetical protein
MRIIAHIVTTQHPCIHEQSSHDNMEKDFSL